MIIKKMTAGFGVLENETLELKEGLNIIYAPNESGKSTWCAFISSMLYGVNSSAREKGGVKPDKVRFAPWSGSPMAGSMEIEYQGRDITLLRSGRESAPMRDFSAVLTGTSQGAGIPAAEVGETLLGVSRDVFERTAFIGQGRVAVSASPELEKRIAAIVQTGDEQSSFTEAEDSLKAAQRRCRYGKSGRLPEIEGEINAICQELEAADADERREAALTSARQQAVQRRSMLIERVAEARKDQRKNALEQLTGSREELRRREAEHSAAAAKAAEAQRRLSSGIFGTEEPEESRRRVSADLAKRREYESAAAKGGSNKINLVLLILLFAVSAGLELLAEFGIIDFGNTLISRLPSIAAAVLGLGWFIRFFAVKKRRERLLGLAGEILMQYGCENEQGLSELLDDHFEAWEQNLRCNEELREAQRLLERAGVKQAELESSALKALDFSEGDSEAARLQRMLEQAESELRRLREEAAVLEGRRSVAKKPKVLRERLSELEAEHEKQTIEYEAISLALDTLREAATEIQNRMTPLLSKRCSQLFFRLTAGRYDAVELDKELRALTLISGEPNRRETAFLSAGALDQLYLALRLAMTELALPEDKSCPIILDDALVNFDDSRCRLAMELLGEFAQKRQVILFTCHRREKELFAEIWGN